MESSSQVDVLLLWMAADETSGTVALVPTMAPCDAYPRFRDAIRPNVQLNISAPRSGAPEFRQALYGPATDLYGRSPFHVVALVFYDACTTGIGHRRMDRFTI